MHLDGLFRLLDGAVVLTLANLTAVLVADRVEGEIFGIVVLVTFLLFEITVNKSLLTVEVDIVAGVECVPPARLGRVVLGGAGGE